MDNFMLLFIFYYLKRCCYPCSGDIKIMALPSVTTKRPIDGAVIRTLLHLYAEVASFR